MKPWVTPLRAKLHFQPAQHKVLLSQRTLWLTYLTRKGGQCFPAEEHQRLEPALRSSPCSWDIPKALLSPAWPPCKAHAASTSCGFHQGKAWALLNPLLSSELLWFTHSNFSQLTRKSVFRIWQEKLNFKKKKKITTSRNTDTSATSSLACGQCPWPDPYAQNGLSSQQWITGQLLWKLSTKRAILAPLPIFHKPTMLQLGMQLQQSQRDSQLSIPASKSQCMGLFAETRPFSAEHFISSHITT